MRTPGIKDGFEAFARGTVSMDSANVSLPLCDRIMEIAKATLPPTRGRPDFRPDDALVEVGFSSLDLANLMIAVEAEFDVMIPASHLTPMNFRSVASITTMLASILPENASAG